MRFHKRLVGCVGIALVGCAHQQERESADARFEKLSEEFIRTHYDHRPIAGVSLGWHQYDGKFEIRDGKALSAEIERLRKYDQLFSRIRPAALTPQHQFDLNLVKGTI